MQTVVRKFSISVLNRKFSASKSRTIVPISVAETLVIAVVTESTFSLERHIFFGTYSKTVKSCFNCFN